MTASIITGTGEGVRVRSWVGFTLSGLVGFLAAIVTITMSYSDVAHTATEANRRTTEHAVRLRALEQEAAAAAQWRKQTSAQLQRIEAALRDK
jgi:hypothetical protein